MRTCLKSLLTPCLVAVAASQGIAQTDPYKPPLYWSTYEYNIIREHIGVCYNYIPEYELLANINWVNANLKNLGYNLIEVDGWGDSMELNQNGYRTTHSRLWEHDYAYWSTYLRSLGMRLGVYTNPLWIHVNPSDTQTKVVGTNINVTSLIDTPPANAPPPISVNPTASGDSSPKGANACGITGQSPGNGAFTWVNVDKPGAEQYVKGYIKYYADMGVPFIRVDFLPWYETGFDHYLGHVGTPHTRAQYETALRWMREACDQYGVYLSITMANLYNEAELERKYAHSIRIDEDVDYGEWWKLSDKDRGHRFPEWSQWANAFDGLTYWSYISGKKRVRLDGDFIRINTFMTDSERRTAISIHTIAGGLIGPTDQYNSIDNEIWAYQNTELLALNADDFVGHPLTNDPSKEVSQIWTGPMSNGDAIVGLFNRESTARLRTLSFSDIGVGTVAVRDLWQHADLGLMNSVSVVLPPHGSMVLRLTPRATTCRPQSITFNQIPSWIYPAPPPTLSASASSGLPVVFEVALGPATVDGNQLHPTDQSGTAYVVAKQAGDGIACAAIPQVQSFNASGPHQTDMFLFGTFTSWTPLRMHLVGDQWVAHRIWIGAGAQQYKFANTNDFSGTDWGSGTGLTGTATVTTGGGANGQLNAPQNGFYSVSFDDVTRQYLWQEEL
jgi:hypothetical protein